MVYVIKILIMIQVVIEEDTLQPRYGQRWIELAHSDLLTILSAKQLYEGILKAGLISTRSFDDRIMLTQHATGHNVRLQYACCPAEARKGTQRCR